MWCAEISCNKNVIGKIPIKTCEERGKRGEPASQQRMRKQRRRGRGQERLMERGEHVEKSKRKRRTWGIFSLLTTGYPATPLQEKKHILASFVFSSLSPLFFKSCFHLAHGSAPSNSWVSQTKSYFLIHSLSHIIILLDRVHHFFFQGFFSSTACSVLGVTSQPQWGKGGPARTP